MAFVKYFECPCGKVTYDAAGKAAHHANGFCQAASTLPASAVTDQHLSPGDDYDDDNVQSRTHGSGWTISAAIHEDWYFWINDFVANHPEFGFVKGNFEDAISATSEKAFNHFFVNHPPESWDYGDI